MTTNNLERNTIQINQGAKAVTGLRNTGKGSDDSLVFFHIFLPKYLVKLFFSLLCIYLIIGYLVYFLNERFGILNRNPVYLCNDSIFTILFLMLLFRVFTLF